MISTARVVRATKAGPRAPEPVLASSCGAVAGSPSGFPEGYSSVYASHAIPGSTSGRILSDSASDGLASNVTRATYRGTTTPGTRPPVSTAPLATSGARVLRTTTSSEHSPVIIRHAASVASPSSANPVDQSAEVASLTAALAVAEERYASVERLRAAAEGRASAAERAQSAEVASLTAALAAAEERYASAERLRAAAEDRASSAERAQAVATERAATAERNHATATERVAAAATAKADADARSFAAERAQAAANERAAAAERAQVAAESALARQRQLVDETVASATAAREEATVAVKSLGDEVQRLTIEAAAVGRLRSSLAVAEEAAAAAAARLSKHVTDAADERARLLSTADAMAGDAAAETDRLRATIATLESDLRGVKDALAAAIARAEVAETASERHQAAVVVADGETSRVAAQLEATTKQLADAQAHGEARGREAESLSRQLRAAEEAAAAAAAALAVANERTAAEVERSEAIRSEATRNAAAVGSAAEAALREELEVVRAHAVADKEAHAGSMAALSSKLDAATERCGTLDETVARLTRDVADATAAFVAAEARASDAIAALAAAEARCRDLADAAAVASARSEADVEKIAALTTAVDAALADAEAARADASAARAAASSSKAAADAAKVAADAAVADSAALRDEVSSLQAAATGAAVVARGDLSAAQQEADIAATAAATARAEMSALRDELASARAATAAAKVESEELRAAAAAATAAGDASRESAAAAEAGEEAMRHALEALKKELELTRTQLEHLHGETATLRSDAAAAIAASEAAASASEAVATTRALSVERHRGVAEALQAAQLELSEVRVSTREAEAAATRSAAEAQMLRERAAEVEALLAERDTEVVALAAARDELARSVEEMRSRALSSAPAPEAAGAVTCEDEISPELDGPPAICGSLSASRGVRFAENEEENANRPPSPAPSAAESATMSHLSYASVDYFAADGGPMCQLPLTFVRRHAKYMGRADVYLRMLSTHPTATELSLFIAASRGVSRVLLGSLPKKDIVRKDPVSIRTNAGGWMTSKWPSRHAVFVAGPSPALVFFQTDTPAAAACEVMLLRGISASPIKGGVDGHAHVMRLSSPLLPNALAAEGGADPSNGELRVALRTDADLKCWVRLLNWFQSRPPPGLPERYETALKQVRYVYRHRLRRGPCIVRRFSRSPISPKVILSLRFPRCPPSTRQDLQCFLEILHNTGMPDKGETSPR